MGTGKDAGSKEKTSRRQFAKSVAAALVTAPLAASALAHAQTPAKTKEATAPPSPTTTPSAAQKSSPVALAYVQVARARFADKLTPEQMEQLEKEMQGNVTTAESLRAVKLRNDQEPDFVFGA